jgi:DNA-binding NarL/FixJ family response regulator
VVVLDIDLRGESSLGKLPVMRRGLPAVRFIIFSGHNHPEMIRRALEAGASAYVTKAAGSGQTDYKNKRNWCARGSVIRN